MTLEQLGLVGAAKAGAAALLAAHPGVVFTSGRRSVSAQASAMAGNVARNRQWIAQTYRATPERDALQSWVDRNPHRTTASEIAAGLVTILESWDDAKRGKVSKHFSGEAFDVQPVPGEAGERIKATIRGLPGLSKFLDKEGGLVIWHAQF